MVVLPQSSLPQLSSHSITPPQLPISRASPFHGTERTGTDRNASLHVFHGTERTVQCSRRAIQRNAFTKYEVNNVFGRYPWPSNASTILPVFCRGSQTAVDHFLSPHCRISTVSQLAIVSQDSGSTWESSKSCYGKPLWSSILVFSWPDRIHLKLRTLKGGNMCSAAETRACVH